jgi:hypothetical protein
MYDEMSITTSRNESAGSKQEQGHHICPDFEETWQADIRGRIEFRKIKSEERECPLRF